METNENHWTSAVFRIMSKNKSIKDICMKINSQPTNYYVKGKLYSKRNPESKIREENLWILNSKLGEQDTIEDHIEYFLLFLKENEAGIRELQPECEFEIMCAYSSESGQGGFTLDHQRLKALTAYPIDLSINLYPPEGK
jgi:hypothetical protein